MPQGKPSIITSDGKKQCPICEEWKPLDDFFLTGYVSKKTGLPSYQTYCKLCASAKGKVYFNLPGNREKYRQKSLEAQDRWKTRDLDGYRRSRRRTYLQTKYQLSEEAWDEMLIAQAGLCEICRIQMMDGATRVCVDHDHDDGHVRGLLCSNCNIGIGLLGDDPDVLDAAVQYLRDSPRLKKVVGQVERR
jgi:hypothetical protein